MAGTLPLCLSKNLVSHQNLPMLQVCVMISKTKTSQYNVYRLNQPLVLNSTMLVVGVLFKCMILKERVCSCGILCAM